MKFLNLIVSPSQLQSFYKNADFQGSTLRFWIQIPGLAPESVVKLLGNLAMQQGLEPLLEKILPGALLLLVCFWFHSDPALCDDYVSLILRKMLKVLWTHL